MKTKKECRWKAQEYDLKIIGEEKDFILAENKSKTKVVFFYKDLMSGNWSEHKIRWNNVDQYLCSRYGITMDDLKSKNRKAETLKVRIIAMYIRIQKLKEPSWKVSRKYGRRDSYACRVNSWIFNRIKEDPTFEDELEEIFTDLNLS